MQLCSGGDERIFTPGLLLAQIFLPFGKKRNIALLLIHTGILVALKWPKNIEYFLVRNF